jgi:hypothetical protein
METEKEQITKRQKGKIKRKTETWMERKMESKM